MPSVVLRTPRIALAPDRRAPLGNDEHVRVRPDDPRHVIGHELMLVGLGLMGVEGLFALPAFEETESTGPLEVLGPPVVHTPGVAPAADGDLLQRCHGAFSFLRPKLQVAGECMHGSPDRLDVPSTGCLARRCRAGGPTRLSFGDEI